MYSLVRQYRSDRVPRSYPMLFWIGYVTEMLAPLVLPVVAVVLALEFLW